MLKEKELSQIIRTALSFREAFEAATRRAAAVMTEFFPLNLLVEGQVRLAREPVSFQGLLIVREAWRHAIPPAVKREGD